MAAGSAALPVAISGKFNLRIVAVCSSKYATTFSSVKSFLAMFVWQVMQRSIVCDFHERDIGLHIRQNDLLIFSDGFTTPSAAHRESSCSACPAWSAAKVIRDVFASTRSSGIAVRSFFIASI